MAQPKSSKQKRASQNKASRQALAARKDNAQYSGQTPVARPSSSGSSGRTSAFGRVKQLFNPTPPAPKSASSGSSSAGGRAGAGAGAAVRGANQPIGHRAALSAVFAAVAAAIMCVTFVKISEDANGKLYTPETLSADFAVTAARASIEAPEATPAELVKDITEWAPGRQKEAALFALWPISIAIIFPVVGSLLGFQAIRQKRGSKVLGRYVMLAVVGAIATVQLAMLFLPSVVALAVARYQVRKAEGANAVVVGDASTGKVVEADIVEAEVVETDLAPDDE